MAGSPVHARGLIHHVRVDQPAGIPLLLLTWAKEEIYKLYLSALCDWEAYLLALYWEMFSVSLARHDHYQLMAGKPVWAYTPLRDPARTELSYPTHIILTFPSNRKDIHSTYRRKVF